MTGSSVAAGAYPDFYTVKYAAADGALLWERRYNGPADGLDSATAVALDGTGNVVVTGTSVGSIDSFGNQNRGYYQNRDYYTAKYAAADGALLWEQRYNSPWDENDSAIALAVDGNGNALVTGSSDGIDTLDIYTAKYAAADGALLWEKRSSGLVDDPSEGARAVAVDASGNVVVTGVSRDGDPNINGSYFRTSKYAAANGALLWEKRYLGLAKGDDFANAVALNSSGNVVVTGVSDTRLGGFGWVEGDYYTAKYAAADGALLWEKRYNGPASFYHNASAVAVDGSGNVVVTGTSVGSIDSFGNQNLDYYTAKYAAANGVLLWEKRYDGPANSYDWAEAMAVDGSGNVVVTGGSYGSRGNADYYTAKYAAADGALLWERRYNGPANVYDIANAVAVDGSGNVVLAAGHESSPDSRGALEQLCRTYWYPLYAFVRRHGHNPHDAQDSTQEFFAWLIGHKHLRVADKERGKFRSFLLCRLKHFLSDERKKARAQKRGGGQELFFLDIQPAEDRYRLEPATDLTPEKIFDQRWALTVMQYTVARLREEYVAGGRTELFEELKHFQPGEEAEPSYAEVAVRLGLTESGVKSAIWRLRQRSNSHFSSLGL